jgi:hypothetical protein
MAAATMSSIPIGTTTIASPTHALTVIRGSSDQLGIERYLRPKSFGNRTGVHRIPCDGIELGLGNARDSCAHTQTRAADALARAIGLEG